MRGAEQMLCCLLKTPPLSPAPCQRWLSVCQLSPSQHPSCRDAGAAQAHGQRDGRGIGRAGAAPRERGELFKEEHQSVRDGEGAGSDRSGLKSHLSPCSYYVNDSCSLPAEVIADSFWKRLLRAKTPGVVPCSRCWYQGCSPPCARAVSSSWAWGW